LALGSEISAFIVIRENAVGVSDSPGRVGRPYASVFGFAAIFRFFRISGAINSTISNFSDASSNFKTRAVVGSIFIVYITRAVLRRIERNSIDWVDLDFSVLEICVKSVVFATQQV